MAIALPTSYECEACGAVHAFPYYAFECWNEAVFHSCVDCGADYGILFGEPFLIEEGMIVIDCGSLQ